MRQAREQLCAHCDYDISGLARAGWLVRCPECGGENRMGQVDLDATHMDLPPWWHLALGLGWPAAIWALFAGVAWRGGDVPTIIGVAIIGGLVLFVAVARGAMIAFDCSAPRRRTPALLWTTMWAVLGSAGTIAIGTGGLLGLWALGHLLQSIRPG